MLAFIAQIISVTEWIMGFHSITLKSGACSNSTTSFESHNKITSSCQIILQQANFIYGLYIIILGQGNGLWTIDNVWTLIRQLHGYSLTSSRVQVSMQHSSTALLDKLRGRRLILRRNCFANFSCKTGRAAAFNLGVSGNKNDIHKCTE